MTTRTRLAGIVVCGILSAGTALWAAPSRDLPDWVRNTERYLQGRLEVGTRVTVFSLTDGDRTEADPFIGNITELDEDQNYSPLKLFARLWMHPCFGLELAFDEVCGKTWNINTHETDGKLKMGGPIFSALGRYPNQTIFTPYAGLGLAVWGADFSTADYWALGYYSPQDWRAIGSPQTSNRGQTRKMKVDGGTGLALQLGCGAKLSDHWSADLHLRWLEISSDAEFDKQLNGRTFYTRHGSFAMDHFALGLGVVYGF